MLILHDDAWKCCLLTDLRQAMLQEGSVMSRVPGAAAGHVFLCILEAGYASVQECMLTWRAGCCSMAQM